MPHASAGNILQVKTGTYNPHLKALQWLPIAFRTKTDISNLFYKARKDLGPLPPLSSSHAGFLWFFECVEPSCPRIFAHWCDHPLALISIGNYMCMVIIWWMINWVVWWLYQTSSHWTGSFSGKRPQIVLFPVVFPCWTDWCIADD